MALKDVFYENRHKLYYNLGRINLGLNDIKSAKAAFITAQHMAPNDHISSLYLADIYYTEQQYRKSFNSWSQFIEVYGYTKDAVILGINIAKAQKNHLLAKQLTNRLKTQFPQ